MVSLSVPQATRFLAVLLSSPVTIFHERFVDPVPLPLPIHTTAASGSVRAWVTEAAVRPIQGKGNKQGGSQDHTISFDILTKKG